jgi:penicillin-binding protein 1A
MWIQFMQTALKGHPEHSLDQPTDIISIRIDPLTGMRAMGNNPNAIFEYFMQPFVPGEDKENAYANSTSNPAGTAAPAAAATTNGDNAAPSNQTTDGTGIY